MSDVNRRASPANRVDFSQVGVLGLIFFSLYFDIGLGYFDARLPSVTVLFACFFLPRKMRALRCSFKLLVVLTGFGIAAAFFSEARPPFVKVISSWSQTGFSVFVSILILIQLSKMNAETVAFAAKAFVILLASLTLTEIFGITGAISDSFGKQAYGSGVGYNYYGLSDVTMDRDISLTGGRRPTVFSPEPSTAALGLSVAVLMFYLANPATSAAAWCGAVLFGAWFVFKSPTPIAAVIALLVLHVASQRRKSIIMISGFFIIALYAAFLIEARLLKLMEDEELIPITSEGIRLLLPFLNVAGSLSAGHILGAGPGAQYDLGFMATMNKFGATAFGTNAAALFVFYYGIAGASIMAVMLLRRFRGILGAPKIGLYWCVLLLFLSFSLGATESPRLLGYFALLMGAAAIGHRSVNCQGG